MKHVLRYYQIEAIDYILAAWRGGKRAPVIVAATGAGKSVIFGEIIERIVAKGSHAIVLAHRSELINQLYDKIRDCGITPGVIMANDRRANKNSRVQVASVQTLVNRLKPPAEPGVYKWKPRADIVLLDEAHHFALGGSYDKILSAYPGAKILGATATPERTDGKGLDDLFDEMILVSSPAQLMDEGFLCQYEIYESPMHLDFSGVKPVRGELNEKEVSIIVDKPKVIGDVYETWVRHGLGRPTLVFARNRQHGEHLRDVFVENGVKCEYVDDQTKTADRAAIIERYMTRRTTVLVNIGLFTEGTDFPLTEVIQMTWPTLSLIRFLQIVGRGMRPSPGKSCCTILDHGNNVKLHGLPDDPRQWSLEGKKKRPPVKVSAVSSCKNCFALFRARTRECPRCGFQIIALGDPIPEFIDVELVKREIPTRAQVVEAKAAAAVSERAYLDSLMLERASRGKGDKWPLVQFKNRMGKFPGAAHGVKIKYDLIAGQYHIKEWTLDGRVVTPMGIQGAPPAPAFTDEELFA